MFMYSQPKSQLTVVVNIVGFHGNRNIIDTTQERGMGIMGIEMNHITRDVKIFPATAYSCNIYIYMTLKPSVTGFV